MARKWISGAIKHAGALRKMLGVKKGQKIPQAKLEKAEKASGILGKRARLAKTLESFHGGAQKGVDSDYAKLKAHKPKRHK